MTFNEIGHVVCGDCEGTGNDLDGYRKGQYCYTCNGRGSSLPHTADVILLLLDIHKMLKDDRAVAWNTSGEPTEWDMNGILCNLEVPSPVKPEPPQNEWIQSGSPISFPKLTGDPKLDREIARVRGQYPLPWWSRLFNWRSK